MSGMLVVYPMHHRALHSRSEASALSAEHARRLLSLLAAMSRVSRVPDRRAFGIWRLLHGAPG